MTTDNSNVVTPPEPEGQKGSTNDAPEGQEHSLDHWKSEALEAQKRRDTFAKDLRKAREEIETLKSNQSSKNKDDAEKSGDVTRIKAEYQADREQWQTKLTNTEAQLRTVVIEGKFKEVAREVGFLPEALGDLWKLHAGEFDIESTESGLEPVVKNSSHKFSDYVKKLAEQKPYLVANTNKGGSGATGPGNTKGASKNLTVDDVVKMSEADQRKAFQERPDLAQEALGRLIPRG